MTTLDGYIRTVTTGEPITAISAHVGDVFDIRFTLFDDLGAAWDDGYTATAKFFMSTLDQYSGTADPDYAFQFSGTTAAGVANLTIGTSGTAILGDYQADLILTSGTVEFTIGRFDFFVIDDPSAPASPDNTIEYGMTVLELFRLELGDEPDDGDPDCQMFTDQELTTLLRARVWPQRFTERLNAFQLHHYSMIPCTVLDIEFTDIPAGNRYRVDETSKHVEYISGPSPPADNASIEIKYTNVDYLGALMDALRIMATDRAKFAVRSKVEGMENDLKTLRKEIMDQRREIAVQRSYQNTRRDPRLLWPLGDRHLPAVRIR